MGFFMIKHHAKNTKTAKLVFAGVLRVLILLGLTGSVFAADTPRKELAGHVPAATLTLTPKGDLPATQQLNLAIGLSLPNAKALDDFLTQLYDPASPNYRQYLTPEQFAAKFGPAEADYNAVVAFARRNNLTVTALQPNRLLLDVAGSVADIQRAFHIALHTYAHPTEPRDFFAPDQEPSVEVSLAISDISGLNNYVLPRPKSLRTVSNLLAQAAPRTGSGQNGAYLGNDFRAAYLPGVALTGTGQTVGLLEFDGYYASDIAAYEAAAGLGQTPLQTVLLDGFTGRPTIGPNSGNIEVSLDIEVTIAMAPGLSKVVVFEAGQSGLQNDLLNAMAASNQIKQFSCSWGWGGGPSTTTDAIFKELGAQGQSFFAASGDSDAFTSGATSANGVDNPSLDCAPASCPFITVVGGTTLTTTGPGGSYVSETAWNWGLDNGSYVGTSGGVSSYYSIPSWQAGISMSANAGSTAYRNIPDVALTADNVYVAYGNGNSSTIGGTSCATPLWASLAALMNQQAVMTGKPAVGFINSAIYALGQGTTYSSLFHDVTTGNNKSAESPNNFNAVAGYDLCTGWGTPAGQSLINALAGAPDSLGISPSAGFTSSGPGGGPFDPASQTFVLTNNGTTALTWSTGDAAAWLAALPTSGVLPGHATATVTLSLTAGAGTLAAGVYTANFSFSNGTTHVAQSEPCTLEIGQSIVQNGGFETGDFTGWTLVGKTVVNSFPVGTVVYDAVESSASDYDVAHSGNYGAFLGDDALATLSQSLPTAASQYYLLSFWLDNPATGAIQQFGVSWNGASLFNVLNPSSFGWTNFQFIVTGTGANTVLQFEAENDPSYFGLDDISVTPLPTEEIQTATMTATGFSLSWMTANGLAYKIQYKTDLAQSVWTDLGAAFAGTGGLLNLTDTNDFVASSQRFYRLVVSQ